MGYCNSWEHTGSSPGPRINPPGKSHRVRCQSWCVPTHPSHLIPGMAVTRDGISVYQYSRTPLQRTPMGPSLTVRPNGEPISITSDFDFLTSMSHFGFIFSELGLWSNIGNRLSAKFN